MQLERLLCALGVGLTVALGASAETNPPENHAAISLRVMSFNVRLALVDDGADSWRYRKELFLKTVAEYRADLVGFQEVVAEQHDAIVARFPEYAFVGVAREDGKRQGEWALVGFRRSRFEALADGNFWLSEHPEQPGSKSWNTAWTRICTWVRLRERASGRVLLFANTHLDNVSRWARTESCRLLATRLPQLSTGAPVVLTGDFNMNEDDPAFAPIADAKPPAIRLIDSYREGHPVRTADELTFHAFKGGATGSRIDFIFHSAEFRATDAAIIRTHSASGHYPSDHYPVVAVLY